MTPIEFLNKIEKTNQDNGYVCFVDLHIINDSVIGFYKTQIIKYENSNGEKVSYLFPTTFKEINGLIYTTMMIGSVERNFELPKIHHFSENYGTKLQTINVQSHLYKLLAITQYIQLGNDDYYDECNGLNIKMLMDSIYQLNNLGFPFMRITNNESIKRTF